MRENRLYGSGEGRSKSLPYPYQGPQNDRLGCWRRACCGPWIASSSRAPRNDGWVATDPMDRKLQDFSFVPPSRAPGSLAFRSRSP